VLLPRDADPLDVSFRREFTSRGGEQIDQLTAHVVYIQLSAQKAARQLSVPRAVTGQRHLGKHYLAIAIVRKRA